MEMTDSFCCCLEACQVFCMSPNACRVCWLTVGLGNEFILGTFHETCLDGPVSAGVRLSVCNSKPSISSNMLLDLRNQHRTLDRELMNTLQREGKTSSVCC